jgi:hypothetical protein
MTRPVLIHDEDKLRDALSRLVNGAWRGGQKERAEPCFSIPASYERDADLILAVAIDELIRLRQYIPDPGAHPAREGSITHADPVYVRAWEILGILRDAIHPVVTGILREYIADETKTKAEREIAARALAQIERCK